MYERRRRRRHGLGVINTHTDTVAQFTADGFNAVKCDAGAASRRPTAAVFAEFWSRTRTCIIAETGRV